MKTADYELVADILRKFGTALGPLGAINLTPAQRTSICLFFAGVFQHNYDNFNRGKFLEACDYDRGTDK